LRPGPLCAITGQRQRWVGRGQVAEVVTIVMATRNGAAHLPEQLASLAAQSHRDWRLFVSDDGSTDATLAILKDFARLHPVQIVAGPQRGAAANFLSALCHADLPPGTVALADQDDVWLRGKLARGLRRMASAPGTGPLLYAAESLLTDPALRPVRGSSANAARPGFAPSLCQNLFGGHTTMLNAPALALVRRAGVPADIAYHDWWLYQLIAGAGGRLMLDPHRVALYRQHGGNALGGSGDGRGLLRRMAQGLDGTWGAQMQAQAQALAQVAPLLTPEAQRVLAGFLAAPRAGTGRVRQFRRLGLHRSSRAGTALMLAAAWLGRL
jgi:hypothetical protein